MVQKTSTKTSRVLTSLYLWATCGFTLGTLLLLGPVRWITTSLRASGSSPTLEGATVLLAIGILFVVSGMAARVLSGLAASQTWTPKKTAALVLPGALALGTMALWMNPKYLVKPAALSEHSEHFFIGPYPLGDDLIRIKRKGYTAVVSLLHPAVVPFEPKLIRDERAAAKRAGITLIEIPMLPWVSGNLEALEKIRLLAADTSARYYVHCYLGRDRVNVVRRALQQMQKKVSGSVGQTARSLDSLQTFERGTVERLADGVYLTPYPSDEEYFGYIIAGGVRTVVSLLDPADAGDTLWIGKEKQLAATHKVGLVSKPLPVSGPVAERAAAIVTEIGALPKPIVIHGFTNPSPPTIAFRKAYEAASARSSPVGAMNESPRR